MCLRPCLPQRLQGWRDRFSVRAWSRKHGPGARPGSRKAAGGSRAAGSARCAWPVSDHRLTFRCHADSPRSQSSEIRTGSLWVSLSLFSVLSAPLPDFAPRHFLRLVSLPTALYHFLLSGPSLWDLPSHLTLSGLFSYCSSYAWSSAAPSVLGGGAGIGVGLGVGGGVCIQCCPLTWAVLSELLLHTFNGAFSGGWVRPDWPE